MVQQHVTMMKNPTKTDKKKGKKKRGERERG